LILTILTIYDLNTNSINNINLEKVNSVALNCIITVQCTVQKNVKLVKQYTASVAISVLVSPLSLAICRTHSPYIHFITIYSWAGNSIETHGKFLAI
jgi:hypothetical protein